MSSAPEAIDAATIWDLALKGIDFYAQTIAPLTPTRVDDQIAAAAKDIMSRPLVKTILLRLFERNAPATTEEITNAVMAGIDDGDKPGAIDIAAIVSLISLALPVIQQVIAAWRQRRNPTPAPTV